MRHWLCCSGQAHAVNEARQPVPHWQPDCLMHPPRARNPDKLPECFPVPGSMVDPPVATRVALFHYVTRSEADFRRKQSRGGGQNQDGKPWAFFEDMARYAVLKRACLSRR